MRSPEVFWAICEIGGMKAELWTLIKTIVWAWLKSWFSKKTGQDKADEIQKTIDEMKGEVDELTSKEKDILDISPVDYDHLKRVKLRREHLNRAIARLEARRLGNSS